MMLLVSIYLFLSYYRLLYLHKCTEKDGDGEAWGLYRVEAPPRLLLLDSEIFCHFISGKV